MNPQPPDHQLDAHPTEPPRPSSYSICIIRVHTVMGLLAYVDIKSSVNHNEIAPLQVGKTLQLPVIQSALFRHPTNYHGPVVQN